MTYLQAYERYTKVVQWAEQRYTEDGKLILSVGGVPSRYSVIEQLAFKKFQQWR